MYASQLVEPLFFHFSFPGLLERKPMWFRNGDGGNLALALLGLPPIPGSFMIPLLADHALR